jgi:pimeloyl-ACP methyl ester carboxylesterase
LASMKSLHVTIAVTFIALWVGPACADSIPFGLHKQSVDLRGSPITVFAYRPARCRDSSLLLAFHGSERSAEGARKAARHLADAHCMLCIRTWCRIPATWTGNLTLDLVAWARKEEGRTLAYSMIGHSAGAQFLARLAAFVPHDARRIVIANPGAHVMPSLEVNAPYGPGKVYSGPEGDQALKRYLAQPLTIMLGEDDTELDPRDGAGAKAQGANRLQRGLSAFNTGKELGESHGWQFNWRLIQIPDVGRSSKSMYAAPEAANVFAR